MLDIESKILGELIALKVVMRHLAEAVSDLYDEDHVALRDWYALSRRQLRRESQDVSGYDLECVIRAAENLFEYIFGPHPKRCGATIQ
ncbi:MAG: hypothetical protein KF874_06645 [Rhizobiaceae bacterium]|nr:hypothetical protein [Rhizobiaceae bacterium]